MRGFPGKCAAHWLPGCGALAQTKYLQYRDITMLSRSYSLKTLDIWISFLKLNHGSHKSRPSQLLYENEHATAFWDVPLFADTTQVKANRIDATVIDKTSKQVRVIEMSCPWLENRDSKDFKQTTKYSQMRLELTNRYPEYKVNQYNIIMDVLGGCSKEVEQNIKELVGNKSESIMRQMQKAILSSSLHIAILECSS